MLPAFGGLRYMFIDMTDIGGEGSGRGFSIPVAGAVHGKGIIPFTLKPFTKKR